MFAAPRRRLSRFYPPGACLDKRGGAGRVGVVGPWSKRNPFGNVQGPPCRT